MLFSEPKIPQSGDAEQREALHVEFQCSSASRKFLNPERAARRPVEIQFQCSSASRKFLNRRQPDRRVNDVIVSVLFSEPKIPQFGDCL